MEETPPVLVPVISRPALPGLRLAPGLLARVETPETPAIVTATIISEKQKFTAEELNEIKKRLLAMREIDLAYLRERLEASRAQVPAEVIDDEADACDEGISIAIAAMKDTQLQLINAALKRIDNETYGVCVTCGSQIPPARLRLLPDVLLCKECRGVFEKNRRRDDAKRALINADFGLTGEETEGFDWEIARYAYMLGLEPNNEVLKENLAYAYSERGDNYCNCEDYDQAVADYTKALDLQPKNQTFKENFIYIYYHRGTDYFDKENYSEAIVNFTEALNVKPDSPTIKQDKIIADLTQSLKWEPNNQVLKKNLADAYNVRGRDRCEDYRYDEAIMDFYVAESFNHDDHLLKDNLADAYDSCALKHWEDGDIDNKAIADYTRAIKVDPNNEYYYAGRGYAYNSRGNYDNAIADFTQAIKIDLNNADYYSARAYAYNSKGNYDNAIADYTRAIEVNPNNADYYEGRGYAYNSRGNYDNAIADYTQASNLEPSNHIFKDNLAKAEQAKRTELAEAERLRRAKEADLSIRTEEPLPSPFAGQNPKIMTASIKADANANSNERREMITDNDAVAPTKTLVNNAAVVKTDAEPMLTTEQDALDAVKTLPSKLTEAIVNGNRPEASNYVGGLETAIERCKLLNAPLDEIDRDNAVSVLAQASDWLDKNAPIRLSAGWSLIFAAANTQVSEEEKLRTKMETDRKAKRELYLRMKFLKDGLLPSEIGKAVNAQIEIEENARKKRFDKLLGRENPPVKTPANTFRANGLVKNDGSVESQISAILDAAITVHREMGCGFLEVVYHDSLEIEFTKRGIPAQREAQIPVFYQGQKLPCAYRADFVAYDKIIIELKALPALTGENIVQVKNCLKATQIKTGLLINFGSQEFQYQQVAPQT